MVICTYQKRRFLPKTSLNVHINNVKIINVTSDKILGVHLDNNLLMDTHIDNLCLKLSRLCGLLYRIQNCLSFQAKLLFYNSYVQPCFDYCATIWGFCSDSQINRLSRLQKRFGRLILNDPECSSKDIFKKLKWLTIKERLEFLTVVLVYKCLNKMAPNNLKSLFTFKSCNNKHDHQLRNADVTLSVPKPRSETLRKSLVIRVVFFGTSYLLSSKNLTHFEFLNKM